MKKIFSFIICAALASAAFAGCSAGTAKSASSSAAISTAQAQQSASAEAAEEAALLSTDDMFSERDMQTSYDEGEDITLSDNGSSSASKNVTVEGSTITITAEGTYFVSGSLSDGQLIVNCDKEEKVAIVLCGASISKAGSAAVYVEQADKVFLLSKSGTQNTLSSTGTFASDDSIDAAVFSREDLTLSGEGALSVTCEDGHGIVSKDDLAVTGGTLSVTAASHGLSGKDSVRIAGGTLSITSGKDGLHAENADDTSLGYVYISGGTFDITAAGDGIDAAATLQIDSGTLNITTGGGSANASTNSQGDFNGGWGNWGNEGSTSASATETTSAKGLKASGELIINDGTFTIDSSDDALHSGSNVYINDGSVNISSGDDGLHADTGALIAGGTLSISKSYEGIEGKSITVSGGEISLNASDDGLNAAGGNDQSGFGRPGADNFSADSDCHITISGGTLTIDAAGDGIDSNGDLYVTGGTTAVYGPTNSGNGALDYAGSAEISGGTLYAAGASGMAQGFSENSAQCSIMYTFDSTQSAGTQITLKDSSGNVIASFTPAKDFQTVNISVPELSSGAAYTLCAGSAEYSVTLDGSTYSNGGGMQGGNMRGGGRGMRQSQSIGSDAPTDSAQTTI